jgi:hypothetical protein
MASADFPISASTLPRRCEVDQRRDEIAIRILEISTRIAAHPLYSLTDFSQSRDLSID